MAAQKRRLNPNLYEAIWRLREVAARVLARHAVMASAPASVEQEPAAAADDVAATEANYVFLDRGDRSR
jgi:hypothetical protein